MLENFSCHGYWVIRNRVLTYGLHSTSTAARGSVTEFLLLSVLCSEGLRRDSFFHLCWLRCFKQQIFVKHLLGPSGIHLHHHPVGVGIATPILEMSKLSPVEFELCICVFISLFFICSLIYFFVYLLNKYLLSPFSMPDTVLGTRHSCRIRKVQSLPWQSGHSSGRDIIYMSNTY